jgi:hypothetical protein
MLNLGMRIGTRRGSERRGPDGGRRGFWGCRGRRWICGKKGGPENENGNLAKHMLPLLMDYVYSVEVLEKKHAAVEPDAGIWEEGLDMDKFG